MPRCELCPGVNKCIDSDGPCDSPYLLVGEAPGKQEDKSSKVFVGKTGEELNRHYLPLAGLKRDNVLITNAISCLPTSTDGKIDLKREKDRALLTSCAMSRLYPLLGRRKLIIPMGAFACHAIDPSIKLELQHGFPVETQWGTVFPMYHPASGIHEPKKMMLIRTDWARLRKYLNGRLHIPTDEYAGREDYSEITSERSLTSILQGRETSPLANDTETSRGGKPYCLTLSTQPGTGYLIKATRLDLLESYQRILNRWEGPILFHNWLFDGRVVKQMGLTYPRKKLVDTMVRVYHLGNLPQGLKALAKRELGMDMQDFDDLVRPHSSKLVLDYYRNAYLEDWPKPDKELVRQKDGSWKLKQPHSMKTLLKLFFTHHAKAEANGDEKDPFKMWDDNWEQHHQMIQEKCGIYPGLDIAHAPFDEIVHYACRDSDATVRLFPVLNHYKSNVRKKPQEHWGDYAIHN